MLEENVQPTLVREIKGYQPVFKVRVRVSRIWRPKRFKSEIYDGLHYILIDEEGDAIHAVIEESDYLYVSKKMQEGQIYEITNFYTRKPRLVSKYKIVDHKAELRFDESTKFKVVKDTFLAIPEHSFHVLEFDQLGAQVNTQEILIDVYGCIKSVLPEHQVNVKDSTKLESKCEVFIENLRREDLRITFWGHAARQFDIQSIKRKSPPVLAVFTSLIIGKFLERVTATATNHTCMIIDPHNSAASEYIAEFSRPGDKVKIRPVPFKRPTTEELKNQTTKSVFDLNTLDPDSYGNHSVYCTASILRFPTYGGWWYKGCPSCSKVLKVKEDSGEFFCPKHDAQMPLPCYKVYVTIHDDHNQATVILMGKQGKQLFGISCQDLVNKRLYPTEQTLPEEIKKMVGQTYLFEIQINQYGELVVENVFPSQQSSASMVEQNPSTATPERVSSEKKRDIETSGKTLFITETEKKAKR